MCVCVRSCDGVNPVCCRFLLPVSCCCCCLSRALSQRFRVNWKRTTRAEPKFVDRPSALWTSFSPVLCFSTCFFLFFFFFIGTVLFLLLHAAFGSGFPLFFFLAKLELCNAFSVGHGKSNFHYSAGSGRIMWGGQRVSPMTGKADWSCIYSFRLAPEENMWSQSIRKGIKSKNRVIILQYN